ncbi:outer membrane protein [Winogradskyella sp. R77965]|uniref:outer membrane protein n=1 Tax=Winogradskyella sp. R77965 TaxID=3093872 RepID=UPI0037DD91BF
MKNTTKTIVLFVTLTLMFSIGYSQTEKGNLIIGGSSDLSFSSSKSSVKPNNENQGDDTVLRLSFGPSLGYFIIDKLAIGLQVPVSFSKRKSESSNGFETYPFEIKSTSVSAITFIRYYFSESNIKPFLQGNVGFGINNSDSFLVDFETGNTEYGKIKSNTFSYGFNGGVAFFINSNISIDLGINYLSITTKPDENNDFDFKYIDSKIGFIAGFNLFL